jgi:uroporphyrinogen III methyltransferase/synthase
MNQDKGICYLTGCGPGNAGLLTLRAVEVLRQAEVVVYDNLINEAVLFYAPPLAERIYVGKRAGLHELKQQDINALLVRFVVGGKTVVRLKGGDPFIFGRGGEEAEALRTAGLKFEIIPGVTSGIAAPAFAGIPLTHRAHAGAVVFVTGHDCSKESGTVDWAALAALKETTLVIYMGVKNLPHIAGALMAAGKAPETPAALVQWGTLPGQRSIVSDLQHIAAAVSAEKLASPAIIVIGAVAALAEQLTWFDRGPMSGKRCLITRTREQNSRLRQLLSAQGADVVELPLIQIKPVKEPAIPPSLATDYQWLIFTSPNGAEYFFKNWFANRDIRELAGLRIAAVGPTTRARLKALGLKVDFVPKIYTAETLCAEWPDTNGGKALHVCGNLAQDSVMTRLARLGRQIDRLEVYETSEAPGADERYREIFAGAPPDWVIFCSSSSVRHFRKIANGEVPQGLKIASIGRITSATIREAGWTVDLEASESRLEKLVGELAEYSPRRRGGCGEKDSF